MNQQRTTSTLVIGTIVLLLSIVVVSTGAAVGVRKGDWIEYQVLVMGTLSGEHAAKWARMEVVNVVGSSVNLNVTTQFINGTYLIENITLNVNTGQLGDDFLIPANLNVGDVFYDAHVGNITIKSVEQKNYADAQRTVLTGSTPQTTFHWDKETGILVEAYSLYPEYNFTMSTLIDKTNMWHSSRILSLDMTEFYALVIAFVAIVIVTVTLIWRRKSPPF